MSLILLHVSFHFTAPFVYILKANPGYFLLTAVAKGFGQNPAHFHGYPPGMGIVVTNDGLNRKEPSGTKIHNRKGKGI